MKVSCSDFGTKSKLDAIIWFDIIAEDAIYASNSIIQTEGRHSFNSENRTLSER